jgi:hypothetical protein
MKFRLVWLGSDDDPDANPPAREEAAVVAGKPPRGTSYELRGTEMVRCERVDSAGRKITPLANFNARIVRDLLFDDEDESRRVFGIEAELAGQRFSITVSAPEFGRMNWVLDKLGPQAIVYPGRQQHARAAIQWLSGTIRQERIYTHLGWRRHGPDWLYLQGRGALGAQGLRSEVQVQVPLALEHYQMRPPVDAEERVHAIRASLRMLAVAPDRISFPLLAAVYRAPLGKVNFSVFLTGPSGSFKTALAALCQQHFGEQMDAGSLPAHFDSTANALETLAFAAKDALLVVDDFVPAGGTGDSALQDTAERLFRGAGNQQGRSRLNGNGRLRASRPPRALLLATGEEVPRGQSLRARMLIVELGSAEVDRARLSECQSAARKGEYAVAMSAFLSWVAEHYDNLQGRLQNRVQELRSRVQSCDSHARLPTALAELQCGWEVWLEFALEAGAIDSVEQGQLLGRGMTALSELAARQIPFQLASNPALQFLALLRAALASGRAHVADRLGKEPKAASNWGWTRKSTARRWIPRGVCIGWWTDGNDLYLDSSISYQVAQQTAGRERLAISEQTLRHRLHTLGLLASIDASRQTLLVRRTLEGCSRHVLHLKASGLVGTTTETGTSLTL